MKPAMLEIVRKRSISRSSRDTRTPNSASSCARNSTKVRESTRPVSIRSVCTDGTSTFNFSAKSRTSWRWRFRESDMSDVLVLGGQQVEEQAIIRTPVDIVTLPQAPDDFEAESLQHPPLPFRAFVATKSADLGSLGSDRSRDRRATPV